MDGLSYQTYCPVLRLKSGEYAAMRELADDVRSRILPLFVIPPPTERDPELWRLLTAEELASTPGSRIGRHWPLRLCLLDPRFLFGKLGVDESKEWIPRLFRLAIGASANPWIVADLKSIESFIEPALQRVLEMTHGHFALRLSLDDIEDERIATRIHVLLLRLRIKPLDVLLIIDFEGSDLSNVALVSNILVTSLEKIFDVGLWGQVVWQATSFPESNPAPDGQMVVLPRGEWQAFKLAWSKSERVRSSLMFGDYGADSSKFVFRNIPVRPFPHFRYSTPNEWLVARGASESTDVTAMRTVAELITKSGRFMGPEFSWGDEYIHELAASRGGPGSSSVWRQVNTVHHLTQVAGDQGALHGYIVARRAPAPVEPVFEF
jgi:hypothetical protein